MTNTPATPTPKRAAKRAPKVVDLATKRTAKAAAKATTKAPAKRTAASVKADVTKALAVEAKAAAKATKATPAKRTTKAPTDSPRSQRPLFVDHVHPETYTMSDALDVRRLQLHKRWSDCEASMCTWADQTDAARADDASRAVALRAEMRAAQASTITPAEGAQLAELYAAHLTAQDAFEQLCAALVVDGGASPSHVGKALGIGNSQVRRIVWRARPESKPEGY